MAPTGERTTDYFQIDQSKNKTEGESVWSTILSQVHASSPNKLPSCKLLLTLGDDESGKTSLVAKLQGIEDPKKGSGLEYYYVFIRDEYRDDHTRLGVWVLDGDSWHRNLLKYVVNENTFPHTTVLLTVSMTQPWIMMESLENWTAILKENLDRLNLDPEFLEEQKRKSLKRFQEYTEPGDVVDSITSLKKGTGLEQDTIDLPLDENVLTHNLGVDVVVVVTKTDYMSTLERDYDYKDEHFDFIQQTLRRFCLQCILHVYIPSGWDNNNKISILYENITSFNPESRYSDVIVKPVIRKPIQREMEVTTEDDQTFLVKQQALLSQQVPTSGRPQEPPIRSPAGVQKTSERRLSGSSTGQGSPKMLDGAKVAAGSEGVLQSFFNSLLNRKTGPGMGPSVSPRTSDKSVVRNDDDAEELYCMTRTKMSLAPTQPDHKDSSSTPNSTETGSSSGSQ
ncbi:cytoplasmic dynein 1 light intermediate chain 2-like isoform X2 [Tachypleus tridentatus]|uniref:cytoplasmic dynein 1 light intermediate chain 2-like isoform X2 n=1 Tax=Tachypleus tridentatus TaxID=6853 RepID=UPI003FD3DF50